MRWILAVASAVMCFQAWAGQFAVSPIRIEFSAKDKSQAITVSNNADVPLRIALDLRRWTQDELGVDQYRSTADELVYFPRQFEVPPRQKQVIRIGRKSAADQNELAYRLYINEQPEIAGADSKGQVAMVVSFGVPVFLRPANPQAKLRLADMKVENGALEFSLSNPGNTTQRLNRLLIGKTGGEVRQFEYWYLHPGASRKYRVALPAEACDSDKPQTIELETDQQTLQQTLLIPVAACKNS